MKTSTGKITRKLLTVAMTAVMLVVMFPSMAAAATPNFAQMSYGGTFTFNHDWWRVHLKAGSMENMVDGNTNTTAKFQIDKGYFAYLDRVWETPMRVGSVSLDLKDKGGPDSYVCIFTTSDGSTWDVAEGKPSKPNTNSFSLDGAEILGVRIGLREGSGYNSAWEIREISIEPQVTLEAEVLPEDIRLTWMYGAPYLNLTCGSTTLLSKASSESGTYTYRVEPNTEYTFTITDSRGKSASVTVLSAPTRPGAPSWTTERDGITLEWEAVDGAIAYRIYRGGVLLQEVTDGTSYLDTTVTPGGNSYEYEISAVNISAEGPKSLATAAVSYVPVPPTGVPTLIVSVTGQTRTQATWSAVDGATGYRLYRNGVLIIETTGTTYSDTGLEPGLYVYEVSALNEDGEGPKSEMASATIVPRPTYVPKIWKPSAKPCVIWTQRGKLVVECGKLVVEW